MKSAILFTITIMASLSSFAAPTADQVNKKAFEIIIANSGKMHVEGEGSGYLSTLLAQELTTTAATSKKISNACEYDRNDGVYKCELFILDKDDSGATESSTSIRYILEKDASGLPSSNLPELSVEVSTAG